MPNTLSAREAKKLEAKATKLFLSGKKKEAFLKYKQAAEAGNASAQYRLSGMYWKGDAVKNDDGQAFYWLEKSATQSTDNPHYKKAQYQMGVAYEQGQGVEVDDRKAAAWYAKAMSQGYPQATSLLMKTLKRLAERGDEQAFTKLRRYASEGNAYAPYFLGELYQQGSIGVAKSDETAVLWYEKSVNQGFIPAFEALVTLLLDRGLQFNRVLRILKDTIIMLKKAAKSNNPQAMYLMALLYQEGVVEKKNLKLARVYFQRAADKGHAKAQENLSAIYNCGLGVKKDPVKAAEWAHKAAEQGHSKAQYAFALMLLSGEGVHKNVDKGLVWLKQAAVSRYKPAEDKLQELSPVDYQQLLADRNPKEEVVGQTSIELTSAATVNVKKAGGSVRHKLNTKQVREAVEQVNVDPNTFETCTIESLSLVQQIASQQKLNITSLKNQAENGNAEAQAALGWVYAEGKGVKVNKLLASRWYRKAGLQGVVEAQNAFANLIRAGGGGGGRLSHQESLWVRNLSSGIQVNGRTPVQTNGVRPQVHLTSTTSTSTRTKQPTVKQPTASTDSSDIASLRARAESGDAQAQNKLGLKYEEGDGVAQDRKQAVILYRKAAEQGNANAQNNLGRMYRKGWGSLRQDDVEAAKWYRKAADQGQAAAQNNLGWMCEEGKGVPQDYNQAVILYRKAAEQGQVTAQNNMGRMYKKGRGGLRQDDAEAVKWYRKAAEKGNAFAQFNLGWMYANGKGVPQNDVQAVTWCNKAAGQGHVDAQLDLGWMYENGRGVPKNDEQAVIWYRKAAEQDNAIAQCNLATMYQNGKGVPQNYNQTLYWYNRAADQNHARAQYKLGYMYWYAQGVARDSRLAFSLFEKAAKGGNPNAQSEVGSCYLLGIFMKEINFRIEKDEEKAIPLLQKGAVGGDHSAQFWLATCYERGQGGLEKSRKKMLHWYRKAAEDKTDYSGRKHLNEKIAEFKSFQEEARLGDPDAQFELGTCYEEGYFVEEDIAEAIKWYEKSGKVEAQVRLIRLMLASQKKATEILASKEASLPEATTQHNPPRVVKTNGKLRLELDPIDYSELNIRKTLGRGGFGTVSLCDWDKTEVAVKVLNADHLSEDSVDAFRREACIMARLNHPHVVRFYGFTLTPRYALLMEYMPKGSLFDLLHSREGETLTWRSKYQIAIGMARGLAYLHRGSILHRDLKSLNVLLDQNYNSKLADFGLSKVRSESNSTSKQSLDATAGTIQWMAPELMEPSGQHTRKSDIYSYAMVLWELITRKVPFENASGKFLLQGWIAAGKHEEIPPGTPKAFQDVITQCWEMDPEKRPTCLEIVKLLEEGLLSQVDETVDLSNSAPNTPPITEPSNPFPQQRVPPSSQEYRWDSVVPSSIAVEPWLPSAPPSIDEMIQESSTPSGEDYRWDSGPVQVGSFHGNFWDSNGARPPAINPELLPSGQNAHRHHP